MAPTMPGGPDSFGFLHPRDEAEVAAIVVENGHRRVRVRGAGHSVPGAIAGDGDLVLVLDRLDEVHLDPTSGEVTVGAGVRLGPDPLDPRRSDGLCAWLHARGRALPNLGGVAHQTVAGMLLTGSGGGSTTRDLAASVVGLRLVDGLGGVHVVGADDPRLPGLIVSMGLCGVVTSVSLRTLPTYEVRGAERVVPDTGHVPDLFQAGERGLAAFLRRTPWARVLWWPQLGVRRIVVWEACPADGPGPPEPYHPMPPLLGSSVPVQAAAGAALWALSRGRRWLGDRAADALGSGRASLYRLFTEAPGTPSFRGPWHEILPMDAAMDERLMPTTFVEVFVPLRLADVALGRLRALFDADPSAAGRFAFELYAAPASTAWLSPAFGEDALRINAFWLTHQPDDPRDVFVPRLLAALEGLPWRLHPAKLLPHDAAPAWRDRYPQLEAFLALRAALDPHERFLTPYWSSALGVRPGVAASPRPGARAPRGPGLPTPFVLDPSDAALLERADHVFDLRAEVAGGCDEVLQALFGGGLEGLVPGLVGMTWHTPVGELDGAIVDEAFTFMTLRIRVVAYTPGQHVTMSVDRCTWPLGRAMVEVCDVTPTAAGCQVRWRIGVAFRRDTGPAAPLLLPAFGWLFQTTLDRLAGRFKARG